MKAKRWSITINGDKWIVALLKDEDFDANLNPGWLAATDADSRTIFFKESHVNKSTCIHELAHAYLSYLYLGSVVKVSVEQIEEVMCDFMANRIYQLIKNSEVVYKNLRKAISKRVSA